MADPGEVSSFQYSSFDNVSSSDAPATIDCTDMDPTMYNSHHSHEAGSGQAMDEGREPEVKPDVPERAVWTKKIEFILTAVSFAVGLGNIWRFPHLCYRNGGGAFLIPYAFMLFGIGIPLYFLEVALGQFASRGSLTVWPRICPIFKGLGYGMMVIALMVSLYYNVIISLTIFYLFASFSSKLPWSTCEGWWVKGPCVDKQHHWGYYLLNSTDNSSISDEPRLIAGDETLSSNAIPQDWHPNITSPAEEYWKHYVNGLDNTIDLGTLGHVQWRLALCLLAAWVVVFLCIMRGIKSSGKVAYFTAIFPYIVLFVLFLRGVTLPGAGEGIKFYLKPDFKKMAHAGVWRDAAVQILYSLGPGFGGLLTIGSYNKFHNNCQKDTILISCINCGTSFFAGFVIFSVLGFMSHRSGTPIEDVVEEGPGLAFIAYPEALAALPGDAWIPSFFSIMFFFMLFTLGIGSMFPGIECIITGLTDEFPWLAKHKVWLLLFVCVFLYLLGLPCTTQGGMYVIELIDVFATSFPLLFLTLGEVVVISYIYGYKKFFDDIQHMLGFRPNHYWTVTWLVVTPILLVFVLVFSCVDYDGVELNGYKYPAWGEFLGWLLALSSMIMIPFWAFVQFIKHVKTCHNFMWLFRNPRAVTMLDMAWLLRPMPEWGPALQEHREQSVHYTSRLDVVDILQVKDDDDVIDLPANSHTGNQGWDQGHVGVTEETRTHLNSIEVDLGVVGQGVEGRSSHDSPMYSVI